MRRGKRRQRRTAAFWEAAIARQAEAGISASAFCRREGLPPASFSYWKRKLERDGRSAIAARLIPLEVVQESGARVSCHEYEVLLRTGDVIRVPASFDEGALTRLVSALEAARC